MRDRWNGCGWLHERVVGEAICSTSYYTAMSQRDKVCLTEQMWVGILTVSVQNCFRRGVLCVRAVAAIGSCMDSIGWAGLYGKTRYGLFYTSVQSKC